MALTTEWSFSEFKTALSEDGLSKVIKEYTMTATVTSDVCSVTNLDGTDGGYASRAKQRRVKLGTPSSDTFVAFDNVTSDNLKSWGLASIGKTEAGFTQGITDYMTRKETNVSTPQVAEYSKEAPPLV